VSIDLGENKITIVRREGVPARPRRRASPRRSRGSRGRRAARAGPRVRRVGATRTEPRFRRGRLPRSDLALRIQEAIEPIDVDAEGVPR
jgi:hypothetical protein